VEQKIEILKKKKKKEKNCNEGFTVNVLNDFRTINIKVHLSWYTFFLSEFSSSGNKIPFSGFFFRSMKIFTLWLLHRSFLLPFFAAPPPSAVNKIGVYYKPSF